MAALMALADPLLQVHSTDVRSPVEGQLPRPGWQVACEVAALARARRLTLREMLGSLVQGTRRFWGEEPGEPPANQQEEVTRVLRREVR